MATMEQSRSTGTRATGNLLAPGMSGGVMTRSLRLALPLLAILAVLLARDSQAEGGDPAARGLDLFVHAPSAGPPGGVLPIAVVAVGFTSVVAPAPLPRATVEAAWNPETLGKAASVPPSVKVTTD